MLKLSNRTSTVAEEVRSKKDTKQHIEFMRIVASFLVIVNHTNSRIFLSTAPSATWYTSLSYFFICKIAVPLFFMIMGALLLQKRDTPQKWVSRIIRIVIILVVFSAVYYVNIYRTTPDAMSIVDFLKTIFKSHITNAFWYLYTYLGMLLMLPILQRAAAALSKNQIRLLLFISLGVIGGLPLISIFFNVTPNYFFMQAFINPYIGMVFAGYYIEHYAKIKLKDFLFASVGFIVLITLQVIGTYFLYQKDPTSYLALDNRTFITIVGSAICFYIMIKYLFSVIQMPHWLGKAVCYIGGLTFGIYLLSDLLISFTVNSIYGALIPHTHIMIAMLIWELAIFSVGAVIVAILKAIPPVKKWL